MSNAKDGKTPPAEPEEGGLPTTQSADAAVRSHRSIGPYRLLQKIGEGGMGEVWQAEQSEPMRRRVALKVIKQGMDTKQVMARFEAERQALAMMDHPHVAKILDAGSTPEGQPFFVMEYVSGLPITEHCDRNKLTTAERLGLFIQVCDGVQHAHQKAIIHRDLKPSNVLVSIQDGEAVPKIIDFGVAKATAQRLTERTLFTEVGVLIGTPEYMSPEQADLTTQDVDTRTDVYSLGVMLYELVVGALPFEPQLLREAGFDGIRKMILEVEPPKPSLRLGTLGGERSTNSAARRRVDVPTLRRLLVGDLDWITMKALEKDRARRYGSPAELAADVLRHLRDEPVLAGAPSRAYRVRKFVRRYRLAVVASSAVAATLVAGLGVSLVLYYRAESARNAAQVERERARHGAYAAGIQAASAQLQLGLFDAARRQLERLPDDLRGWEWRYLRGVAQGTEVMGAVQKKSAQAWICATGILGMTTSREIWFQTSGSVQPVVLRPADVEQPPGFQAACSADCRTLVFATPYGDDPTHVVTVDFPPESDPRKTGEYTLPTERLSNIDLSSKTARVVTDEHDGFRAWNGSQALRLGSPGGTGGTVSPDGALLAFTHKSGVMLFDLSASERVPRNILPRGFTNIPTVLRFSPDSRFLAMACDRGHLTVIPVATPGNPVSWQAHRGDIEALAWSPDGSKLATGGDDQVVSLWETRTGTKLADLGGHASRIRSLSFSPNGLQLLSLEWDGVPKVWDWPQALDTRTAQGGWVWDANFDSTGQAVALRVGQDDVPDCSRVPSGETLWRTTLSPSPQARMFLANAARRALMFSSTLHTLITTVGACDSSSSEAPLLFETPCPLGLFPLNKLAVDSIGQHVAWVAGNADFRNECPSGPGAYILALDTARVERLTVAESDWRGATLAFPEDAQQVAIASKHTLEVWGLSPLRLLHHSSRDGSSVLRLAYSAASSRLAVASPTGVRLSTFSDPSKIVDIEHAANVTAMTFSPDGTRLAIGASDFAIRLFEVDSGEELLVLRKHTRPIDAMHFSRDGASLVTKSSSEVHVWSTRGLSRR